MTTFNYTNILTQAVDELSESQSYKGLFHQHKDGDPLPSAKSLYKIVELARAIIFPGYFGNSTLGADPNQLIKALKEAEAYKGPSLIIAYAPCINHGISKGMANAQLEAKLAVQAGYWHLYRFNPDLKKEGKNPFILDSKEPTLDFNEFLMGEVRYASLVRTFPETAEVLLKEAAENAKDKYASYKKLAEA